MIKVKEITAEELEAQAAELGLNLPIEQTAVWANYQATIEGRTPWGCAAITEGDQTLAFISFIDYETHGYHFLRSVHGPAWVGAPSSEQEDAAIAALASYVHAKNKKETFMRFAVAADLDCCSPVLSGVPYDHTVVINVAGGDQDEILSRMKPRGRRDVRKSLRESPAECADETELATKSFAEYYDVMVETGQRDGFHPAPCSDYEDMIRLLGPEHCRVYASRLDGRVVSWSVVTINGTRAVRYYGASRSETMRQHVTDKLVLFECCDLGANKGVETYDMMGIGSDFSPTLMGLNEFKTKFTKEVAEVAPDRDVPLRKTFYKALTTAKKLRNH